MSCDLPEMTQSICSLSWFLPQCPQSHLFWEAFLKIPRRVNVSCSAPKLTHITVQPSSTLSCDSSSLPFPFLSFLGHRNVFVKEHWSPTTARSMHRFPRRQFADAPWAGLRWTSHPCTPASRGMLPRIWSPVGT